MKELLRRWLRRNFRRKEMYLDEKLYMTRYYIRSTDKYDAYVHDFSMPDSDRRLHNHPWKWGVAVILFGSYVEQWADKSDALGHLLTNTVVRRWFNWLPRKRWHRIAETSGDVITLFVHSKDKQPWGFMEEDEGVRYQEDYAPTHRNYDLLYYPGSNMPYKTNKLPPATKESGIMPELWSKEITRYLYSENRAIRNLVLGKTNVGNRHNEEETLDDRSTGEVRDK